MLLIPFKPELPPRSFSSNSSARGSAELLLCLLLFFGSLSVFALQEPTFSTAVNVVNVLANVTDKKGHIIHNLQKDNFLLLEDGQPQSIRYFASQSDLPLVLGILIDASASQERVMDLERAACFRFLDQVLRPRVDKIFLLQFDMGIIMRQELTSSWKDLNDALTQVDTPSRRELSNQTGGGTLLYDALVQSAKLMAGQHGRKAVIVLTDGVDTGSDATLPAALDAAQKSDLLIYSILFSDAGYYGMGGGREGKGVLQRLSRDTGGGFFEVSKKQPIDQVFQMIEDELRNQYSLGYVSSQPSDTYGFRKLQLKTTSKDLLVQARDRYYAHP